MGEEQTSTGDKPPREAEPAPDIAPRDDVKLGINRCPYCHGDVNLDEDFVSCRACNARHHRDCWNEQGACSSCGETRFLAESSSEAPPAAQDAPKALRPSSDLGPAGLGIGILCLALAVIGAAASYQSSAPTLDVPFGPKVDLGEPGFNALGMLITALVTAPLALVGAELGHVGWRRNPKGVGKFAMALNLALAIGIIVFAVMAW